MKTTIREEIEIRGYEIPFDPLRPTHVRLWALLEAMAGLGVFVTETNGFDDEALLLALMVRIEEPREDLATKDLEPNIEELLILGMGKPEGGTNRDYLLPASDLMEGVFERRSYLPSRFGRK